MVKEFWTVTEVVETFEVETGFLRELEDEEIVCPVCRGEDVSEKVFSLSDLENLRLAKLLVEDMGVNLPGVEIILRMRRTMFEMRSQFDGVLEDMAREVRRMLET
jgi:MerR family transcriptional regulator/heat shock protein HspR